MTKKGTPWEYLAKYFAGELTQKEEAEMEAWIKADSVREKRIHKLHLIWEKTGSLPYTLNVDEAWELLSANMEKLDREKGYQRQSASIRPLNVPVSDAARKNVLQFHDERKTIRTRRTMQSFTMVAAAVMLITAGTFIFSTVYNTAETQEVVTRQYAAGEGERASYLLSDGTRVILHSESRIEVPENFASDNRELYLDGEAWFEVSHDPENPFIVHSEYSKTRVLGTKFMIQAWPHSTGEVEVVVAEGKVAFGSSTPAGVEEVILAENQKAVMARNQAPVVSDIDDLGWYLGWAEGKLVFDNRSLNEIIPKLERWYVLDIQVEDESIGEKRFSAEIDYSQPMTEVLVSIALSLDLEIERDDRLVTFRFKDE